MKYTIAEIMTKATMYGKRVSSKPSPLPIISRSCAFMNATTSDQPKPREVEKVLLAVAIMESIILIAYFFDNFDHAEIVSRASLPSFRTSYNFLRKYLTTATMNRTAKSMPSMNITVWYVWKFIMIQVYRRGLLTASTA